MDSPSQRNNKGQIRLRSYANIISTEKRSVYITLYADMLSTIAAAMQRQYMCCDASPKLRV